MDAKGLGKVEKREMRAKEKRVTFRSTNIGLVLFIKYNHRFVAIIVCSYTLIASKM